MKLVLMLVLEPEDIMKPPVGEPIPSNFGLIHHFYGAPEPNPRTDVVGRVSKNPPAYDYRECQFHEFSNEPTPYEGSITGISLKGLILSLQHGQN
jgi:hypothetical protein